MNREDILRLQESLVDRRKDIFDRVRDIQSRWQSLGERAIEPEEEAQKATITEPYDRLDENGKDQIDLIDLALSKISLGEYGICEACGDDIAPRRLEVLPWARLCVDCARDYEKRNERLPKTFEVLGPVRLPDEYQGLMGDQIVRLIQERLRTDRRINMDELQISIRRGILYLDGSLSSEAEHQILRHTLTDVMGFTTIVDHLDINELLAGRKRRAAKPVEEVVEEADEIVEEILYDTENMTEDLWEAGDDETPYSPPVRPLPQQDQEYGAR